MDAIIAHHQPVFCRGIKEILANCGSINNVTIVHKYSEIIEKIKAKKNVFLIMEEKLPEHDITDCLPWMLKVAPTIKIILLTLSENATHLKKLYKLGAAACVDLNGEENEIIEAVKQTNKEETFISPRFTKYLIEEVKEKANNEKTVKEIAKLSDKEYEVYLLLRQNLKGKEIATKLFISYDTFKTHRWHLRRKLKKHKLLHLLD